MKKIFCIIGPSASGKTTIGNYLKKWGIKELISHTTRKPRKGEIEGKTYYYVSEEVFLKLDKIEETHYSDNFYCLSKKEVENKLNKYNYMFIIVDKEGLKQLKKEYNDMAVAIYFYSTIDEVRKRLIKRDGFAKAYKRIAHAYNTEEFSNNDIADYIIRSKTGKLKEIRKILKIIVKLEGYKRHKILWGHLKYYCKRWF